MDRTVCELFAGVGGFRKGLNNGNNNWNFVWTNQWEPSYKTQHAFNIYIKNFGYDENNVNEDIAIIDKTKIPNHNLLVGGFPCQDYSVARTGAQGIRGKKGVLWWQIYETIEKKEPPFILLENVDRLLKSPSYQRGRDFGVMLASLNNLGYSVEWRVINAADYGFPQRRRRVFIFAFKNNTNFGEELNEVNYKEWIYNKGFFQSQFPVIYLESNDNCQENLNEYKDLVEVSDTFHFIFQNTGLMSKGIIYTESTEPLFTGDYKTLGDILEKNVDERYYLNDKINDWKYLKGAKKIERVSKNGHKYTFSEGTIAFPDPIDKPSRTMLTSESSKNRSTHIIEEPQTGKLRKLTPIETERLNGFPDNWTNLEGVPEKFRYFAMGNALVVGIIEKLSLTLVKIFDNEK